MKYNVLIVSYYFPPVNSMASLRVHQFAHWLPKYNWIPTILTAENIFCNSCDLNYTTDSSRIIRIKGRDPIGKIKHVIKQKSKNLKNSNPAQNGKAAFLRRVNPFTNARLPDIAMWWQKKAIKAGLNHISNNRTNIIFSSFGPPSSHIVASKL